MIPAKVINLECSDKKTMLNLTKAIYSQFSGSALSTAIGGRLFKGQAPEGADYPYIVYQVVTNTPDHDFSNDYENTIVQFSIFSITSSTVEIENCYTDLKALYDEQDFSITGSDLVWMRRSNANFVVEDHVTPTGTQRVWVYHVDFSILTSLN